MYSGGPEFLTLKLLSLRSYAYIIPTTHRLCGVCYLRTISTHSGTQRKTMLHSDARSI